MNDDWRKKCGVPPLPPVRSISTTSNQTDSSISTRSTALSSINGCTTVSIGSGTLSSRNTTVPSLLDAREQFVTRGVFDRSRFFDFAQDGHGSIVCQKFFESSTADEIYQAMGALLSDFFRLCRNRFSSRVIQKAMDYVDGVQRANVLDQLQSLSTAQIISFCMDQNANHVLQKIFETCEQFKWAFIVDKVCETDANFLRVVEDKYGCRVLQLAMQRLVQMAAHNDDFYDGIDISPVTRNGQQIPLQHVPNSITTHTREQTVSMRSLWNMLHCIMLFAERLMSNEFANFVVSHVLTCPELSAHRATLIEQFIMGNVLSLSQEKFASHVVERALQEAPAYLRADIIEEVFDGYLPNAVTGRDALDIMLFHPYGNYVVQRILRIIVDDKISEMRHGIVEPVPSNCKRPLLYYDRIRSRIREHCSSLARYSSGKKIIDVLVESEQLLFKEIAHISSPNNPAIVPSHLDSRRSANRRTPKKN